MKLLLFALVGLVASLPFDDAKAAHHTTTSQKPAKHTTTTTKKVVHHTTTTTTKKAVQHSTTTKKSAPTTSIAQSGGGGGIQWGSIQNVDYLVSYSTSTYPNTLDFCSAWRLACIDFVGPLDRHHGINCQLNQPNGKLYTVCLSVQKDAQGNNEKGPYLDMTPFMLNGTYPNSSPNLATILANPKDPAVLYNGTF